MNEKQLHPWESWPLWALGISNGLNIALWYVLSMARVNAPEMPIRVLPAMAALMPLIVVAGGIAAALALDGVLIATIAGTRHGRSGIWSWLTIVGAALFSGAIAYAVHRGGFERAPVLHVAQAIVLALYNLHLSQPKKALQAKSDLSQNCITDKERLFPASDENAKIDLTHPDGFKCRLCGEMFPTPNAVKEHRRNDCSRTVETIKLHRDLSVVMQHDSANSTNDAEGV